MNTKFTGQHPRTRLVAMLTALLLAACGGGGGGNDEASAGTGGTGGGGVAQPPATGTDPTPQPDNNPPPAAVQLAVTSVSPDAGATGVALNSTARVTFNVNVDPATVVSLAPTAFTMRDVTNGNNVEGIVQLDAGGTTAIFTPRNNLVPNAEYAVTVTTAVRSTDGTSLTENRTWNFTAAAPAVQSTYPAAGATTAAPNSKVAAVFNTAVSTTGLTFTVTRAGGVAVPGMVTYDNDAGTTLETKTAVFNPTSNLEAGVVYTARVDSALTEPMEWTFTTGTELDTVRPTVTFSPAGNAENVGTGSEIRLTFSEAINLSKVNSAAIYLSDPSYVHISGSLIVDAANNTISFFPSSALAPNTPYHIVVNDRIEDLAGNRLDTGSNTEIQSNFTTGAQ